jgi:plasmid stabilization system protein ParE
VGRKVVWSEPAADDLVALVEFIAKDSQAFAATLAQRAVRQGIASRNGQPNYGTFVAAYRAVEAFHAADRLGRPWSASRSRARRRPERSDRSDVGAAEGSCVLGGEHRGVWRRKRLERA